MSDRWNTAKHRRLRFAVAPAVAVCVAASASAQRAVDSDSAPHLPISQYQHDHWTSANGLSNSSVNWMARSPDGYLWLGTEGGLVRFDGVRFTAVDRSNTTALQGSNVYPTVPLLVDRQGVLWLSTSAGMVRYKDGEFARATTSPRMSSAGIQRMVQDRAGRFWVAGFDIAGPMVEMRDGRFVAADSQSGMPLHAIAAATDSDGDLLIATADRGLLRVHGTKVLPVLDKNTLPPLVTTLFVSRDSVIWVGTPRGFGRLEHGRFAFRPLGEGLGGYVSAFAEDGTGDVWIGTLGTGVLRWHAGTLERFDPNEGLPRNEVTCLLVDPEGSVWVGTRGGLHRFRRGAVATLTRHNGGPPFAEPGALVWDRDRFVLGGATAGLVTGTPNAWTPWPGVPATRKIWTIARAKGGGFWVGGDDTLTLYRPSTAPRVYTQRDGLAGKWVLAVAEDSLDRVWVGTNEGLFYLTTGGFRRFKTDALPDPYVHALIVDRHGALWVATNGGVARVVGDSLRRWGVPDGIAGPLVITIRETQDGSIWLGTSGGLSRIRDGKVASVRTEQGLPEELVMAIEEAAGDLWIETGNGIGQMSLSELNAVADGRSAVVHAATFDTHDGLLATGVIGGTTPLTARTPDGRLWFSTAGGIAVVNPRWLPRNTIVPPVHIEELSADDARLTLHAGRVADRVPPRTKRVTFRYTATSLLSPERVRFRYQLVGYDRAWVDASSAERTVSYTSLRPGHYTFRVIAANDAGVWNLDGASLAFTVAPAFYQTIWFATLCAGALVAAIFALHRARVLQLERRAEERKQADEALTKLRAELAHATRVSSLATLTASIAHEVSQPLSGIVTNASTCLRMLSNETPNVAGASEAARRLLRDGHRASDVITRLRALFSKKPSAAEQVDLNDAAREVVALSRSDLQRAHATLGVELPDGLPPVLGDRVQLQQVMINLLRNACDAVQNVTGRPREIVVSTARDGNGAAQEHVRLSVRDSGVGFGSAGADKLFDAFYSTKPDGMGIGLSVCRSIIENHGGRIWATPNDGPGVTFAFSIPVAPDDARQPSTRQLAGSSLMS